MSDDEQPEESGEGDEEKSFRERVEEIRQQRADEREEGDDDRSREERLEEMMGGDGPGGMGGNPFAQMMGGMMGGGPGGAMGGGGGPGGPGGFGGADFSDVFGDIFGDIFGGGRGGSRAFRGADLRYRMEVSLEEAVQGVEREIRIPTQVRCDACEGSGAAPGSQPQTCPTCKGHG